MIPRACVRVWERQHVCACNLPIGRWCVGSGVCSYSAGKWDLARPRAAGNKRTQVQPLFPLLARARVDSLFCVHHILPHLISFFASRICSSSSWVFFSICFFFFFFCCNVLVWFIFLVNLLKCAAIFSPHCSLVPFSNSTVFFSSLVTPPVVIPWTYTKAHAARLTPLFDNAHLPHTQVPNFLPQPCGYWPRGPPPPPARSTK